MLWLCNLLYLFNSLHHLFPLISLQLLHGLSVRFLQWKHIDLLLPYLPFLIFNSFFHFFLHFLVHFNVGKWISISLQLFNSFCFPYYLNSKPLHLKGFRNKLYVLLCNIYLSYCLSLKLFNLLAWLTRSNNLGI